MPRVGGLKKKDADRARANAGKANKGRSHKLRKPAPPVYEPNPRACVCIGGNMPQRRKGEGVVCCKCGKPVDA